MAQKLNSFSGVPFIDSNGDPYAGAQLFVYQAGSSTKQTVTKDLAGASNHTNPIILNSSGLIADGSGAAQALWQPEGQAIKLVLAPAGDTDPPVAAISSWDNLSGVNDTTTSTSQWISAQTPTFVSSTTFTVAGDHTTDYHANRRIKLAQTSGTEYGTIISSAYTSLTTVTVEMDGGVNLDSGLSQVDLSLLTSDNDALPQGQRIIRGGTPFVFEGATADGFETSIAVTDPTADRTQTLQDRTGDISLDNYVTTAGTSTAYTATYGITAYAANREYLLNFDQVCGDSPTVNLDSLGAKTIKTWDGYTLAPGVLAGPHRLMYDGTDMILVDYTPALLDEQEVTGSDVTTVTFTGLDMNSHKSYRIEIDHLPDASSDTEIAMYANNDTTATNYYFQQILGQATTVTGARSNAASITSTIANSRNYIVVNLGYGTGLFVHAQAISNRSVGSGVDFLSRHWSKSSAISTNLTRLDFTADQASGIRVGSIIRIYRGDV